MKEILLSSSVLIVILAILRQVLRGKIGLRVQYALWLLAALRLLIPVQFGNLPFNVATAVRQVETAAPEIQQAVRQPVAGPSWEEVYAQVWDEKVSQGIPLGYISTIQPYMELEEEVDRRVAPTWEEVARWVWISGMTAMGIWFAVTNLVFWRKARRGAEPMAVEGYPLPVWVTENIPSPCLLGLFRPAVYLTPACAESESQRRHVLAHEYTHLRHGDVFWSLVRCLCLCIYWFNPLVWLAAVLSRRDCELACDEGALERLPQEERLAYGKTLIDVVATNSVPAQIMRTATTMVENKKQLKQRVKLIAKKPKMLAVTGICLVLIVALAVGCTFTGAETGLSTEPAEPSTEPSAVPTTAATELSAATKPAETKPTEPKDPSRYAISDKELTIVVDGNGGSLFITDRVTKEQVREVTWTTEDESICSVDGGGKVTALKVGTTEVLATVNGETHSCAVECVDEPVKFEDKLLFYQKRMEKTGIIDYTLILADGTERHVQAREINGSWTDMLQWNEPDFIGASDFAKPRMHWAELAEDTEAPTGWEYALILESGDGTERFQFWQGSDIIRYDGPKGTMWGKAWVTQEEGQEAEHARLRFDAAEIYPGEVVVPDNGQSKEAIMEQWMEAYWSPHLYASEGSCKAYSKLWYSYEIDYSAEVPASYLESNGLPGDIPCFWATGAAWFIPANEKAAGCLVCGPYEGEGQPEGTYVLGSYYLFYRTGKGWEAKLADIGW